MTSSMTWTTPFVALKSHSITSALAIEGRPSLDFVNFNISFDILFTYIGSLGREVPVTAAQQTVAENNAMEVLKKKTPEDIVLHFLIGISSSDLIRNTIKTF